MMQGSEHRCLCVLANICACVLISLQQTEAIKNRSFHPLYLPSLTHLLFIMTEGTATEPTLIISFRSSQNPLWYLSLAPSFIQMRKPGSEWVHNSST